MKDKETRRRWRYAILWGVSFGIFIYLSVEIISILVLFGDESQLGYVAVFKSLRNPLDLFMGIALFLLYPLLISLPFGLIITLGTYWQELRRGDLLINRLLYPVKKHFSDQSPDNILEQLRILVAKFIDR
jgi:hypothetical protein